MGNITVLRARVPLLQVSNCLIEHATIVFHGWSLRLNNLFIFFLIIFLLYRNAATKQWRDLWLRIATHSRLEIAHSCQIRGSAEVSVVLLS